MESSKKKKDNAKKNLEQLLLDEMQRDAIKPDVEKIEEILKAGVNVNGGEENAGVDFLLSEIERLKFHLRHGYLCSLERAHVARMQDRANYCAEDYFNQKDREYTDDEICEMYYLNYHNLDLRVVKLLLEYGADVNRPDEYSVSPLHAALFVPVPELFELLLEYGADPNYKDEDGYTVLDQAYSYQDGPILTRGDVFASEKMGEVIEVLKKHGAKHAVYGEESVET